MTTKKIVILTCFFWCMPLLTWILCPTACYGEISIIDDTGKKIVLKHPARRLVTLYGALTETICAIGACKYLVGVTKRDNWPPECKKKTKIGTHMRPNLEIILGLKPDLVLQGSVRKGSQPVVQRLESFGIPVAIFNPTDFNGLFSEIQRLGILTGNSSKAQQVIKHMKTQLNEIKNAYPLTTRPKVIFEVSYPSLLVAGKKNFVSDLIFKAGGINPVKTSKKLVKLSLEAIISYNPDVYVIQRGPMNRTLTDPFKRPNFSAIKAIKEGRTITVDEFTFSRPTPRSVTGVKILRQFLFKYFGQSHKGNYQEKQL